VTTGVLSLQTNTRYELRIRATTLGGTHQAQYGECQSQTVWSSPPFVLPAGVTADSAEAGIVNNIRSSVSPPAITPSVSATVPTVAGGSTTVTFAGGQAGSPGAYLFGLPPASTNFPITTWFSLDLPPVPLIAVPFVADASGSHSIGFSVDPSLSGASLGVQAGQLHQGPPPDLYGTNAWTIDIQ
jgi:hypothetical protein